MDTECLFQTINQNKKPIVLKEGTNYCTKKEEQRSKTITKSEKSLQETEQTIPKNLIYNKKQNHKGTPYEVAKAEHMYLQDVSGILSNSIRYVLYGPHTSGPGLPLYLQPVDTKARKPLGVRITVGIRTASPLGQTAAMDPRGRFVIYSALMFPDAYTAQVN